MRSVSHTWSVIRSRLGLDDVRLHDLRHFFASFLVNSGCSLYEVQKNAGPRRSARHHALCPSGRGIFDSRRQHGEPAGGGKNKKTRLVLPGTGVLGFDPDVDVAGNVLREMDKLSVVFSDMPQVTVQAPKKIGVFRREERLPQKAPADA